MSCRTHFRSLIILTSCSASPPAPRPPKNWLMCQAKKALRQQGQHRHRRSLTGLKSWWCRALSEESVQCTGHFWDNGKYRMISITYVHYVQLWNGTQIQLVLLKYDISALAFGGSFEGWGARKRVYEKWVCLKSFKNWCLINVDHRFPHKIAIWIQFRH